MPPENEENVAPTREVEQDTTEEVSYEASNMVSDSDSTPQYSDSAGKPQQKQMLLLMGLGAVLAFATGVYAFSVLTSGDSRDVLDEIWIAWNDVDTLAQDTSFAFSMDTVLPTDASTESDTTSFEFELEAESRTDRTDRTALKADASIELDVGVDAGMFAFNEGVEFDFKLNGTTAYVQITRLPAILALFGMGPLQDEWILIESDDVQAIAEGEAGTVPVDENAFGRFLFADGELTEADQKRLGEIVARHQVISLEETDETDTVFDTNGTHELTAYALLLHTDDILALVDEVLAAFGDRLDETELAEAQQTRDSIAYLFANLTIRESKIWIDDSYLVYRVVFDAAVSVDHAELEVLMGNDEVDSADELGDTTIDVFVDVSFKDFNGPVVVEFPENARLLEEILDSMGMQMDATTPDATLPAPDTPLEVSERAEFLNNMANVLAPFGFK